MNEQESKFNLPLKIIFKMYFAATALIALLVQAVIHLWPSACEYSFFGSQLGVCRANYYFIVVYLLLVPIFLVKIRSEIRFPINQSETNESLAEKITRKVFAWIFLPFLIVAPFLFLSKQHYFVFKNQLVYGLLTESFLGLVVSGAFMSFGSCLCIWILLTHFPVISFRRK